MIKLASSDGNQFGFSSVIAQEMGIEIPDQEKVFIDYRRGNNAWDIPFDVYSATEVKNLPVGTLQNKIILIGPDEGHTNRLRTPFSVTNLGPAGGFPGVLIEAQVLAQLIEGRTFSLVTLESQVAIIVFLATLGFFIALVPLNIFFKALLPILGLVSYWIFTLVFYTYDGSLLPLLTPSVAFIIAIVLTSFWQWKFERNRREKVHNLFGQFLAPTVVEQIIENPEKQGLDGELREVTLLFTDIEGFTSLTESTNPEIMVKLVNEYLDGACNIVMKHNGTIDKIVGDALHVMFNAPIPQPDHACLAIKCVLELDKWFHQFKSLQEEKGIKLGITRIGVNTGDCIVGNFGGNHRFDYTAYGDAINTTARLESVNKQLGTSICISEKTAKMCTAFQFLPIGHLLLRGKGTGINTVTPVDTFSTDNGLVATYLEAYNLLEKADSKAIHLFNELALTYPENRLIKLHRKRVNLGDISVNIDTSQI